MAKDIEDEGDGVGISARTLKRARKSAGVVAYRAKDDPKGPWWLRLGNSSGGQVQSANGPTSQTTWPSGHSEVFPEENGHFDPPNSSEGQVVERREPNLAPWDDDDGDYGILPPVEPETPNRKRVSI